MNMWLSTKMDVYLTLRKENKLDFQRIFFSDEYILFQVNKFHMLVLKMLCFAITSTELPEDCNESERMLVVCLGSCCTLAWNQCFFPNKNPHPLPPLKEREFQLH